MECCTTDYVKKSYIAKYQDYLLFWLPIIHLSKYDVDNKLSDVYDISTYIEL